MIRDIAAIGEATTGGDPSRLLEAVVEDIEDLARKAKGKPYLVRVELSSTPPELRLVPLELDHERAREYA